MEHDSRSFSKVWTMPADAQDNKDEFDNGERYFPFDGQDLWRPPDPRERPSREFLEWHGDVVFRG